MKASLSHFCATAASFIAIVVVVVVARPYPNASGSHVNAFRERCGRNGKDCCRSYGKDVRAHWASPLHHVRKPPAPQTCSSGRRLSDNGTPQAAPDEPQRT